MLHMVDYNLSPFLPGLTDETKQKYKVLNAKGDDGLVLDFASENKQVTVQYKLKGATKHTESFKIGETTEVVGLSGKTRQVRLLNQ